MQAWWLTFTDGTEACCEGRDEYDAKVIAEKLTGKTVAGGKYTAIAAKRLPNPATPLIWQHDHPVYGKCPPFCFRPERCAAANGCTSERACND